MADGKWIDGETLGMTNSYWMVIGTVAAIGATSQFAKSFSGSNNVGGGQNVDAQGYWNNLSEQEADDLMSNADAFADSSAKGSLGRFRDAGAAGRQLWEAKSSRAGEGLANWRWHKKPTYK
jgi:hypothetical protein